MKILLAGPGLCAPLTEGRKRFARDLANELSGSNEVQVVTTVDSGTAALFDIPTTAPAAERGLTHLVRFHHALHRHIEFWRPDLVCHLPIGSFHGAYRYGNLSSIWLADRQCAWKAIPCFTLMYAIAREAPLNALVGCVRHLLVSRSLVGGKQIRFGTALPESVVRPSRGDGRSLLFMAGMAQRTRERLNHVLQVRGLAVLLRAGQGLSSLGFRLTVAVPLLSDPILRDALFAAEANTWPQGSLHVIDTVSVPEIFDGYDFMVFPYSRDETQFVPTSVVEAMNSGVATVLSDLPFLQPLIQKGDAAYRFPVNDSEALVRILRDATLDIESREKIRSRALAMVRESFDIRGTSEDVLRLYHEQFGAQSKF